MRYMQFEHERIGAANELGLRYLTDFPRLEPFYAADFHSLQDLATHALKLCSRTWRSRFERDLTADLCQQFAQQHQAPPPVLANIERLRDKQCVCIVTGQQAGLGGGPLLVLYKALTCVRLAAELEAALAQPVVPVFWVASDDSDIEEVNRFRVLNADDAAGHAARLTKFRFDIPAGKLPVREIGLPPASDPQWEKLRALLPKGPGHDQARAMLDRAAGRDFGAHFSDLLFELLGARGLVVIEPRALPSHPAWKRILASEIEDRQEHRLVLRRAADRLEAQGLNAGVPVSNQLNMFRHVHGERRRISDNGAKLAIDGSDSPMTKSALMSALKADPAGFSPSALLRPVIQNAIFPTVAYVGGQAEIAYHALLKGLHRATQTFMPVLFPRLSLTLVESSDMAEFAELLKFRERLRWRQQEARVVFEGGERAVRAAFAGLRNELGSLSKPLASEITRLEAKTVTSIADVRNRVEHEPLAVSRNSANVARLLERYFPGGNLQERELTLLGELARQGERLVASIEGVASVFDFRHHVAEVSGAKLGV